MDRSSDHSARPQVRRSRRRRSIPGEWWKRSTTQTTPHISHQPLPSFTTQSRDIHSSEDNPDEILPSSDAKRVQMETAQISREAGVRISSSPVTAYDRSLSFSLPIPPVEAEQLEIYEEIIPLQSQNASSPKPTSVLDAVTRSETNPVLSFPTKPFAIPSSHPPETNKRKISDTLNTSRGMNQDLVPTSSGNEESCAACLQSECKCTPFQTIDDQMHGLQELLLARAKDLKYRIIPSSSGFVKIATGIVLHSLMAGEIIIPSRASTGVRRAVGGDEFYAVRHGFLTCDVGSKRVQLSSGDLLAIPENNSFEIRNPTTRETCVVFFSQGNQYS